MKRGRKTTINWELIDIAINDLWSKEKIEKTYDVKCPELNRRIRLLKMRNFGNRYWK